MTLKQMRALYEYEQKRCTEFLGLKQQLQNDLAVATMRADEASEEATKLHGAVWRLETENKSLTQQVADARKGWETAIYEKAKIEGYMLRVREDDAKSLGKVWHEAFEKDSFGNPVFR